MSTTATQLRELADVVDRLEDPSPNARVRAAEEVLTLIGNVPALAGELTELRRIAALELRRRGFKVARIAELAGVTSSAISQLLGPDCLADPLEATT